MRLPVLRILIPSAPYAIMVNGTLCGTSTDPPILPVGPTGTVFITCLPIAHAEGIACMPYTISLSLRSGQPQEPVYGCTLYLYESDAIDVRISPPLCMQQESTQSFAASRTAFSHSGHSHAATLYYDGGWRVAIEETGKDVLLLCHPVKNFVEGKVRSVSCLTSSDVLVTGRGSLGPRSLLFSAIDGKYALAADENAYCTVEDHAAVFTQPLSDVARHEKRFSLGMRGDKPARSEPEFGHFSAPAAKITDAHSVCAALCEAVSLGLFEEAFSYMTPELKADMTPSDLSDFFGAFKQVYEVEGQGPYTVQLGYMLHENVYRLRGFVFEMDGLLVANVVPEG